MCPPVTATATTPVKNRILSNDLIPSYASDMDFRIRVYCRSGTKKKKIIPALSSKIITTNIYLQNPDRFNVWIVEDCVHPGLAVRTTGFIQPRGPYSYGWLKLKVFNRNNYAITIGNYHIAHVLCLPHYTCN